MKASHRALFAVSFLVLGGCAGMQDKSAMNQSKLVEDQAYIARVEQTARSRGVTVRWVNPPQKHVAAVSKDL